MMLFLQLAPVGLCAVAPQQAHNADVERLTQMRNRINAAMIGEDRVNVRIFTDFIAEARRLQATEDEAFGWLTYACYYYNENAEEELNRTLPEALKNIERLGYIDYYYDAKTLIVEKNLYEGKVMHAIDETKKMFKDAERRNSDYGVASSNTLMGEIYSAMQQRQQAIEHFEQAIKRSAKVKNEHRLLMVAYPYYTDALIGDRQFTKLQRVCKDWHRAIDDYAEESRKKRLVLKMLNDQYASCFLAMVRAKTELGNREEAWADLQRVARKLDMYNTDVKAIYYRELTRYYEIQGNYRQAIDANTTSMELARELQDSMGMLESEKLHAHLLMAVGRNGEAAKLLSHLIEVRDSLHTFGTQKQMAEMSTFLTLYEEEKANKKANVLMGLSLAALLGMGVILLVYAAFSMMLRKKDKAMVRTVQRFKHAWQLNLQGLQSKPQGKLSSQERLYMQLCKLMDEKKPYLDPEFNRDTLTRELNTNRIYLAEAIRIFSNGLSISKFITRYRLQYAASLLMGRRDVPMTDIAERSGFTSRRTYNRLFREYFGMTPAAFRNHSADFNHTEAPGNDDDEE